MTTDLKYRTPLRDRIGDAPRWKKTAAILVLLLAFGGAAYAAWLLFVSVGVTTSTTDPGEAPTLTVQDTTTSGPASTCTAEVGGDGLVDIAWTAIDGPNSSCTVNLEVRNSDGTALGVSDPRWRLQEFVENSPEWVDASLPFLVVGSSVFSYEGRQLRILLETNDLTTGGLGAGDPAWTLEFGLETQ